MDEKIIRGFLKNEDDLFCLQYENVEVWKYIRGMVYDSFLNKNYRTNKLYSKPKRISDRFFLIKEFIKKVIFSTKKVDKSLSHKDILFYSHPRRFLHSGDYISTYMDEIIHNTKRSYVTIEYPLWIPDISYHISHFPTSDGTILNTDREELVALLKCKANAFARKIRIRRNIITINKILDTTRKILGENVCEKQIIKLIDFYSQYEKNAIIQIKRIVEKVSPLCVIEVYTPDRQTSVLNIICHNLKIPIIELQHGVIYRFEPIMYSFFSEKTRNYMSDYFLSFGDYWIRNTKLHIPSCNAFAVGFPFFEKEIKNRSKTNKQKILIISQSRYHDKLFEIADYLSSHTSYEIEIKLHPYENSYLSKRSTLKKLHKRYKVIIGCRSVYDCFKKASVVVGVSSTGIFEALEYGLPVFYLKGEYGTETFYQLERHYPLFPFNDGKDLIQKIQRISRRFNIKRDRKEELYKKNSLDNATKKIEEIIEKGI